MTESLKLPTSVESCREAVDKAFQVALLGDWPQIGPEKDSPFEEAAQPRAIAQAILWELHPHLTGVNIAYVYRKDMKGNGKTKLGTAKKASAELVFFSDFDFVLSFNWSYWAELSREQRIALVDHELMHCGRNDAGTGFAMVPHDVEEFGAIVRRWGLWKPDLQKFARAIGTEQLSLLTLTEAVANLAPQPGSGIDSVTLEAGGESVTLTQADGERLRRAAGAAK